MPSPFADPDPEDQILALAAAPVRVGTKVIDMIVGTAVGGGLGYVFGGLWGTITGGALGTGIAALVGNDLRVLGGQLARESYVLLKQMYQMEETTVQELTSVLTEMVNQVHAEIRSD